MINKLHEIPTFSLFNNYEIIRKMKFKINEIIDAINTPAPTPEPPSPVINYSTEEQVIGTWIDGKKPVYEKTMVIDESTHTFASGFNNVEYSSNYPITNIDEIIGHNGSFCAIHKTEGFKLFCNIGSTGATNDQFMYLARVTVDNGNLTFIQFNIPANMITYYQSHRVGITIRYTKTTN